MRRAWLVIAWAAATALVSFGTFQALSFAQSGVGTGDLSPVVVASTEGGEATPQNVASTTSSPASGTSGAVSTSGDTSPRPRPATPTSASTSVTTTPATSTTATTIARPLETRTVQSPGGAVTVRVAPGIVEFVGAVPSPGFGVEVDDAGPTRVRVEFESDVARHEVRIEWESGELRVTLD